MVGLSLNKPTKSPKRGPIKISTLALDLFPVEKGTLKSIFITIIIIKNEGLHAHWSKIFETFIESGDKMKTQLAYEM